MKFSFSAGLTDHLGALYVILGPEDFAKIDELGPPRSAAIRYYCKANGLDLRPHQHKNLI